MLSREELGVIGLAADVSTDEGRAAIAAEVRKLGRLDWLVDNAGAGGGTAGLDVDVERARRVLETNFYSHVALTHELWPLLCDSPRARVIVVSSSLGTYSSSGSITYGASKAALTSWGRALAVAARRQGIEVTVVNPGPVVTTTFPHHELLQHRWKRKLVIDVERCVERHHAPGRPRRRRGLVASALPHSGRAAGDPAGDVRPLPRLISLR